MRRARVFLAITAYIVFIEKYISKSFIALFGSKPKSKKEGKDSRTFNSTSIPVQIFISNRFFTPQKMVCNLGLVNGFFDRHLRI
ncbi:hypothetical protein SAMN05216323_10394 [Williamwhitmania taraxaci]|uniref:Uncharacterized protein n=1 Tax=Williamwhitmania taraxaci TaxID=1640674 RepID=A0A1G6MWB7_9BACT|nr:hypothetical protein SAMN05216323_10394 [Williamwhitmania taraxaci]